MEYTLKKQWSASAPANIALIKYMGKLDSDKNLPLNASISYTLENCRTFVEVEPIATAPDQWQALDSEYPLILSEHGQQRFLKHVDFLKKQFSYEGNFLIRSANNFPSDCGLASSASSYAALTLAMCEALTELSSKPALSIPEMAHLSQQASGSSCRSFYSPWCLWQENTVTPVDTGYGKLLHQVIIVDSGKKQMSSSSAHKQVQSSALYQGRAERAELRLDKLLTSFKEQNWQNAYEICWQEFWDMHALFETSEHPFGYMTAGSLQVLTTLRQHWNKHKDGPIITMDAGANVHCLYRTNQSELMNKLKKQFSQHFVII